MPVIDRGSGRGAQRIDPIRPGCGALQRSLPDHVLMLVAD